MRCLRDLSEQGEKWSLVSLFHLMTGVSFNASLIIFHNILKVIHVAHKGLQSIDDTVANAASIIENLKVYFEKLRSEESWNDMWKEITEFCKDHDIAVPDEDTHLLPRKKEEQ